MLPWKRLIRPLAALCLAAAATVVPATAARAADTAAAPSRGWNDYSCKPLSLIKISDPTKPRPTP
ncbi:hypothetical protein PV464_11700, partial [Streptomyces scabiei]|nr:hypothetical protein [Streptomyces scabiei]